MIRELLAQSITIPATLATSGADIAANAPRLMLALNLIVIIGGLGVIAKSIYMEWWYTK